MTFDEWLKAVYPASAGDESELFLRQAWDAATRAAVEIVTQASKRYTCKVRKAVLRAVADQISRGVST